MPRVQNDAELLRASIGWTGDQSTAGPLSRLTGRSFAARLDDDVVSVVLVRYVLDKSSLNDALLGRHVMVVDAIVVNPSLPPHAMGGKPGNMTQLASFSLSPADTAASGWLSCLRGGNNIALPLRVASGGSASEQRLCTFLGCGRQLSSELSRLIESGATARDGVANLCLIAAEAMGDKKERGPIETLVAPFDGSAARAPPLEEKRCRAA